MFDNDYIENLIKNPKEISKLDTSVISEIINQALIKFRQEDMLIELQTEGNKDEIYVFGDIHGNLDSLLRLLDLVKQNKPKYIIFLGDIVDRGPKQSECLVIILALKINNPNRFYLLRGNHESIDMNKSYGFYQEFITKFCNYDKFTEIGELYHSIPICVIVDEKILCVHGGIPENLDILNEIRNLKKKKISKEKLMKILMNVFQMMWNDPKKSIKGFKDSIRGPGSKFFGKDVFDEFMNKNNLDYLIRSHEVFQEGYKFFFDDQLLSIFSSANYRGKKFSNPASYAIIRNKKIHAKILK